MIERADFIRQLTPVAQDEENRSGIKPIITLTQAAHESNWGNSELTAKANNLFGFTGESWEQEGKPVIKLPTSEYILGRWMKVDRPFRSYKSWAESVRDWASLMQRSRYTKAYEAAKLGDIDTFSKEVAAAGYATDPNYAKGLMNVAAVINSLPPQSEVV